MAQFTYIPNSGDTKVDTIVTGSTASIDTTPEFQGLGAWYEFRDTDLTTDSSLNAISLYNVGGSPEVFNDGERGNCGLFTAADNDRYDINTGILPANCDTWTFGCWFKINTPTANTHVFEINSNQVGMRLLVTTSIIYGQQWWSDGSSSNLNVTPSTLEGVWHCLLMRSTESGGSTTWNVFIDGVKRSGSDVVTAKSMAQRAGGTRSTVACDFNAGATSYLDGYIQDLVITPEYWSDAQCQAFYDNGFAKFEASGTIEPATAFTDADMLSLSSVTATYTGTLGVRMNGKYWNGAAWVTSSTEYNDISTANTNISSLDVSSQEITPTYVLISSDRRTDTSLTQGTIGYVENSAPAVYAGMNKPTVGTITDISTYQPFSDCTISDVDSNLASASYSVNGGAFNNIPLGGFASFQEAARAITLNASILGVGTHTFVLKAIDALGSESTDSLTVTIVSSSVTVNAFTDDGIAALRSAIWGSDVIISNEITKQFLDYFYDKDSRITLLYSRQGPIVKRDDTQLAKKIVESIDLDKIEKKIEELKMQSNKDEFSKEDKNIIKDFILALEKEVAVAKDKIIEKEKEIIDFKRKTNKYILDSKKREYLKQFFK